VKGFKARAERKKNNMVRRFAVIDTCRDGISAVAARWNKSGEYVTEAFHRGSPGGVAEGVVTDLALATEKVKQSLSALKKKTGKSFHHVYSAVSSPSISIIPSEGTILISKYGREISERDVAKCLEIASTVKIPLDRYVLHKVIGGFSVDGEKGIREPVNLEAVKLGAQIKTVTITGSVVNNLSKCVAHAGYIPQGFVFSGIASSNRILSKEDMLGRTAYINVGHDITEVLVFSGGALENCKVFPHGLDILLKHDDSIDIDGFSELASSISAMRGWTGVMKIVTGGRGAPHEAVIEAIEGAFGIPVSSAICSARPFENLPEDRSGYTVALGALDQLTSERSTDPEQKSLIKRASTKLLRFLDEYF
jgi:hypothetical protein